jgi:ribosomal protein S18 acetylase RimI-like enzyme
MLSAAKHLAGQRERCFAALSMTAPMVVVKDHQARPYSTGESMPVISLHDKDAIEHYLRRNTPIHLYELGDLDDFFWPYTSWYALEEAGQINELALLYTGLELPTLLAITENPPGMRRLLELLLPVLPGRFYAHLSEDLASVLAGVYRVDSHGLHYKMALVDPLRLETVDTSEAIALSTADVDELRALYRVSYPDNWFDPRMLETGFYYGIRRDARLVAVAGVHVYSPRYKVGVIGNVTTHPDYRGQGLAKTVCAKLCVELLKTADSIGLNVKADNISAIAAYKRLGFEVIGEFEECVFTSRSSSSAVAQ